MRKYLVAFKTSIQSHLIYPGQLLIWSVSDILYFAIFPFVWLSIYSSGNQVAGYAQMEITSYYIAIIIVSSISITHNSREIRDDIHQGHLNSFLTRPVHYLLYKFAGSSGFKFINLFIAGVILLTSKLLFTNYIKIPFSISSILIFAGLAFISFLISFLVHSIIGLSAFWTGENSGILNFYHLIFSVFSGSLAPLALFPKYLQIISDYLPFKFLLYLPAEAFLEKINAIEIFNIFSVALIWVCALLGITLLMWHKGIKTYEGRGI